MPPWHSQLKQMLSRNHMHISSWTKKPILTIEEKKKKKIFFSGPPPGSDSPPNRYYLTQMSAFSSFQISDFLQQRCRRVRNCRTTQMLPCGEDPSQPFVDTSLDNLHSHPAKLQVLWDFTKQWEGESVTALAQTPTVVAFQSCTQ